MTASQPVSLNILFISSIDRTSPFPIMGIEHDSFNLLISSQLALPVYLCIVVLGCKVIAFIPIFSSLFPTSGTTIESLFQPARILTVTGISGTDSTTAAVISSIRQRSFKAAEPAPFLVTFGTGHP